MKIFRQDGDSFKTVEAAVMDELEPSPYISSKAFEQSQQLAENTARMLAKLIDVLNKKKALNKNDLKHILNSDLRFED